MTRRHLLDIGVPIALAVAGSVEAVAADDLDAPATLVALMVGGTTVPLVWRRRSPLLVLVVVLGSMALADSTYNIADELSAPFVGVLFAVYASGAYTTRRDGLIAAAIIGVLVGLMALAINEDVIGDMIFIGGMLYAVWLTAMVVSSRQELATALAARTIELEHEREENARLAVAEERARIARELHDVVAHNLSIVIVQAGAERRAVADERPETAAVLATIEETGRAALAEMRRLLGMLRRSDDELALAPQPSLDHLPELVAQVSDAGLPVDLEIDGEPRKLAPGVDLSAYRIVQEALTNALKHAGPTRARVRVRYGDRDLDIEITDDGDGSPGDAVPGGHGLVGMRERVALFGGDLATGRRNGGGYAVRARLPLARNPS